MHFASILIPSTVLEEVEQLTRRTCASLKLEIVEPTIAQLTEAAQQQGGLSFEDRVCLILARTRGATCLTNDRRLRKECESLGIMVLWGLEPLVYLVSARKVSAESAVIAVRKMQAKNPLITQEILGSFYQKIGWGK